MAKGGAIGRAPRFADERRQPSTPFSPTASTILSEAGTDIAPLADVDPSATRPRAPAAVINPERKGGLSRAATKQAG